jgi:hypothetical protein
VKKRKQTKSVFPLAAKWCRRLKKKPGLDKRGAAGCEVAFRKLPILSDRILRDWQASSPQNIMCLG